ncbi:MAG: SDR family oxidoreductase [Dictyoglomus sp.]|nr:SDR family oxidoreductase [Dictyoglomus sp.]MDW8188031.1 SDR family oxidoreductase [Dictyoglomus sp.]
MKFLVTGGAGFIGSHIVEELVKEGGKVIVLDNLSTGKEENLNFIRNKIIFIKGDIRDLELLLSITKNVDYIFHEAALTSVVESIENPEKCNEVNITGTLRVFIAGLKNQVKRIIYASSSAVYGNDPITPKKEDMKLEPISPYAISKYVGELYMKFFYEIYKLEIVSLRYFNVYGPRQDPNSPYSAVIPKFITSLLKKEPPTIYGDGEQTRDFIFVEDVVSANIQAIRGKGIEGKIFNISSGKRISIKELFLKLKELIKVDVEPIYAPERRGEVRDSMGDITLAKKHLSWTPKFSLDEGLKKTIEWYRKII